jgi:hypothetical protein
MGGVGSKTQIHHVQVSYSDDDSYEWFGGTVCPHHLVAFGGTDDEFDTDFGFQGKIQFCFGLRDPLNWDPTGQSNGFESDNEDDGSSTAEPYTHPIFCNVTLIGPYLDALTGPPPGHKYQFSAVVRRSSRCSVYNSVIAGYPWGCSIRDQYTQNSAWYDVLQWRNVSIAAAFLKTPPATPFSVHDDNDRWAPDSCTTWFDRGSYNNIGSTPARHLADVGLINMTDINDPDAVPVAPSELIGSADFSYPNLAGFFPTAYRGAFDPTKTMSHQWTAVWTEFDPQWANYDPVQTGTDEIPSAGKLSQNFPNPFNPVTTIRYTVPKAGHVSLMVYNVKGEKVATLVNGAKAEGSYEISFNAKGLVSGTYFYSLICEGFKETRKMVLLR